jgi:asparagine synthase (glutamine-hydrolysing)
VSAPEVRRWWSFELDPFAGTPRDPEEEWGGRIRELLDRAVARRLMSDVPLGVFLSGGIDSSSVAAFAARHVGPGELRTFSIGFGERSFDESAYSDLMARQLGTAHENCRLTPDQARDLLPAAAAGLDEPMGDSSFLPTYLLCRETRRHVTVALGGDGADELFAGYAPFRALRAARAWSALVPGFAHRGARLAAALLPVSHNYMSLGFKISRTLRGLSQPPALWNPVWLGPLEPDELAELFAAPVDPDDVYAEAIEAWNSCAGDDVDRTLQFYTRLYLADDILVKADRASMLNSLEVRSPYLDIELVDFVRRIPSAWKLRRGTTKYILKKALEPVLPREIIHRSKQGFAMPVGRWLADGAVAVDPARTAQGLSRDFVRARLEAHRRGRADERLFLWNVWLLGQGSFADSTSPAGPGERA